MVVQQLGWLAKRGHLSCVHTGFQHAAATGTSRRAGLVLIDFGTANLQRSLSCLSCASQHSCAHTIR